MFWLDAIGFTAILILLMAILRAVQKLNRDINAFIDELESVEKPIDEAYLVTHNAELT